MSVIRFGSHELANLCAVCEAKTGTPFQKFAQAAECYSRDNDACYCYTYAHCKEEPESVDAKDIEEVRPNEINYEHARLTARLLRYNLVSNSGRDFASHNSLEACVLFCEASGESDKAVKIKAELEGSQACCAHPEIRGGCCCSCGEWTAEADAGHNLPQVDNEG